MRQEEDERTEREGEGKKKVYVYAKQRSSSIIHTDEKKSDLDKICKYSHIMPPYPTAIQSAKLLKRKKDERRK